MSTAGVVSNIGSEVVVASKVVAVVSITGSVAVAVNALRSTVEVVSSTGCEEANCSILRLVGVSSIWFISVIGPGTKIGFGSTSSLTKSPSVAATSVVPIVLVSNVSVWVVRVFISKFDVVSTTGVEEVKSILFSVGA